MSNLEVVQRAYDAFGRGDVEAVVAALDPQIEWVEGDVDGLPYAGTHHGVQAVVNNVFAQLPTTYDNFALVPQEWVDGGDTIVMLGEVTSQKDGREATSGWLRCGLCATVAPSGSSRSRTRSRPRACSASAEPRKPLRFTQG